MTLPDFREFVYPLDAPRLAGAQSTDAFGYADVRLTASGVGPVVENFRRLLEAPFHGITTDGQVIGGLFDAAENGPPVEAIADAARRLLEVLGPDRKATACLPVDSVERRTWNNGETYLFRHGLRLEFESSEVREAALAVVRASLSEHGYDKVRHIMWMNLFLGELTAAAGVLNEWSYNFTLFGEPGSDAFGWQLYGHHVSLNCLVAGGQLVLTPTFLGAEPNWGPHGPWANKMLFEGERRHGLALQQSLSPDLQRQAVVYEQMNDPAMPPGRWVEHDQRHLGGAFQDNRVIPYEGVRVRDFDAAQRLALLDVAAQFLELLPAGALAQRLAQIEQHLDDTYWSWIGPYEDDSAFYYRIQSPVAMFEFDHHSGVFLANEEPDLFHVHTIVRTPNGNDYGMALLRGLGS